MSLHHRMMLQRYGLGHSTSLYSTVLFDPIFTPLFTAVLGTGGITIGASTITYASIASAIATTALSIGIQMLMAPKPPKPEAAKVPLTQAIPYRIWGVGRCRLAGAYMLWESRGPRLYAIQAIAGHRIKSFNRYWLHDDEVTLNGSGYVNTLAGGRYANSAVRIQSRLGLPTETAYDNAVSEFSASGLWTTNHRGDGQASLCLRADATRMKDQQKRFPYGVPSLSVEADLALCWDFRDPAQDPADPSTWQWTRNAAVIIAWHLCFNEFGFGLDYTKAILPVLDLWIEEADICDEDVARAGGGTEKRYECNGYDTTENGPKSGLNAMLAACDGHLVARGDGARILTVGKFRESRCSTLADRDIVGHNIQYDMLFEDECNRLIPKFTYPATDYTTSDTDYFEDVDAQISAGRILAQEAEYQWVHQWRQARRLGKRDWLRLRQKVKGSIDVRLSGINAVYSRWVRLETPNRMSRLNGKVVENRRSILALTRGGFSMDIVQNPDNIDEWNPVTDEGTQPPVPVAPGASTVPTPVINLVQAKPNNSSVYIRVVIIDPEDASLTPVVRYRLSDNGSGTPGAWVEQSFPDATPGVPVVGYVELNTNVVPSDKLLDVQAAFRTSGGALSDWSSTANVVSTSDPVAPTALASFTLSPGANLGRATLAFATGGDSHVRAVKIYRVATGASFVPGSSTPVGIVNVAASSSYTHTDGDATRTNLLINPGFDADTDWVKGTGWVISAGKASRPAGLISAIYQNQAFSNGDVVRSAFTVSSFVAGVIRVGARTAGGAPLNDGPDHTGNGTFIETINVTGTRDSLAYRADGAFDGAIDNVVMFKQTPSCVGQGAWDYYAIPVNASDIVGPTSGPVTATII